jgi:YD repeat-containing protein
VAAPTGDRSVDASASSGDRARPSDGGERRQPDWAPQPVSLPKGGGAIRGLGEKLAANAATGVASLTIPISVSGGRSGFQPALSLTYDGAAGNGPFGLGWRMSVAAVTRKTERGVPRYDDASDRFVLAGMEDLVPLRRKTGAAWVRYERVEDGHVVHRYRPRTEGGFARIERWTSQVSGAVHWRTLTRSNVTSIFGRSPEAQIADPDDERRVATWLLEESFDDLGNVMAYRYQREDLAGVDGGAPRSASLEPLMAQRYLKRILYGNDRPYVRGDWHFEVVLDYGDHDTDRPEVVPSRPWPCRPDPFSSFRSGFEIRTQRLCRRVLMFHRFAELGPEPCLVASTDLAYAEDPIATLLTSATQTGYIRDAAGEYPLARRSSLPPLELGYTEARFASDVKTLDRDSLANAPSGIASPVEWIDLESEGAAGMLLRDKDAWRYKRNLGGGSFGPAEPVANVPSSALAQASPRIMELAGDGSKYLVDLDETPGYQRLGREDEGHRYTPFPAAPNIAWNDPDLRFVDLDGDGRPDVLITRDDELVWYRSLGEDGFDEALAVRRAGDEERGPRAVFADGTGTLQLADMSGDGLADLVRVRHGEVCFWPNRGHGRFGAKVTLGGAPLLGDRDLFDATRVRLADVDGSGPADLLYLGESGVSIWRNQAGNGFGEAIELDGLPPIDDGATVDVVDLLGTGTTCIVWSSGIPAAEGMPLRYVDLMDGTKPHLLSTVRNNLGAETHVTHAPTTKFYLADRAAGTPWATRMPFPLYVLERLEVRDELTSSRLVTTYSYRHGYYDRTEREFRGFGFVEQIDAETLDDVDPAPPGVDPGSVVHAPPVVTRSWTHTGAYFDGLQLADRFASEFWPAGIEPAPPPPPSLPVPPLPGELSGDERREAVRAMAGQSIRREVYALDGTAAEAHPFVINQSTATVRMLQPPTDGDHGVFLVEARESLEAAYDRNPADPRLGHSVVLATDEYGAVTRQVALGYPRAIPAAPEQGRVLATMSESDLMNRDEPGLLRIGVAAETRTYELTGYPAGGPFPLPFEAVEHLAVTAPELPVEAPPTNSAGRRLTSRSRTRYLKDDLSGPLAFGSFGSHALPFETYTLVFTPELVTSLYGGRVNDALLEECGYVKADGAWWSPSGRPTFAAADFYTTVAITDPFGRTSQTRWDAYRLMPVESEDPAGNVSTGRPHYRMLAFDLVTDPNGNRAGARFDALGRVTATASMGKDGAGEGDVLDPSTREASPADEPGERFAYDLDRWGTARAPARVMHDRRERHRDPSAPWQRSYAYADGFGRTLMSKAQAEPGPAPARGPDGHLLHDAGGALVMQDTAPALRWIGSGRIVYDSKGRAVKRYEPFFSSTPEFETEAELVETGVSSVTHYDPLGRPVRIDSPDGTFARIETSPWETRSFDQNDTVMASAWFAERSALPPGHPERRAAQITAPHDSTPRSSLTDPLGRPFLTRDDLGGGTLLDTRSELDIAGRTLATLDPLGRRAAETRYDVTGRPVVSRTIDAGERVTLEDVAGRPAREWDARGHVVRHAYDELRRPTHVFVRAGSGPERLVERLVYGESLPVATARQRNLRGRIAAHYDGAGVALFEEHDSDGNLTRTSRVLCAEDEGAPDWSALQGATGFAQIRAAAEPLLSSREFEAATDYDALGRPVEARSPDGTRVRPSYNEASLLERVEVALRGSSSFAAYVTDVDYDVKGRRERIRYANGAETHYEYDPLTLRLTRVRTTRPSGGPVQDLSYTYDPSGNVVEATDAAQQTTFFANTVVAAGMRFEFDALYRLAVAEGREHVGQTGSNQPGPGDAGRVGLPQPGDGNAMRRYTETYEIDGAGNLTRIGHAAPGGGSWTRRYQYAAGSNRLASSSLPGDATAGPYSATYDYDEHGNTTRAPHLPALEWDFRNRLVAADLGGGGAAHYQYESTGQRVRAVVKRGGVVEERVQLGGWEVFSRHSAGQLRVRRETPHVSDG